MRNTNAEISSPGRRVLATQSAGTSLFRVKWGVDALPPLISVASSSLLVRNLAGLLIKRACVELARCEQRAQTIISGLLLQATLPRRGAGLQHCAKASTFADPRLEGNKRLKEATS